MSLNVLFIDDEKMVLEALRRSMRGKSVDWNMEFVDSIDEFWKHMETNNIDVVVSDMQMHEVSGADLLISLNEAFPDTLRIMLSGFKDRYETVRSKGAHRFLMKPIMVDNLIHQINDAAAARSENESQSLVFGATGIATDSKTLARLHALLEQTPRVGELATLVDSDPGISMKVLQLGNSPAFSAYRNDLDIHDCLLGIGSESLDLLVSTDVIWAFPANDPRDQFVSDALAHARKVAALASSNPKTVDAERTIAHTAGILHVAGALARLQATNTEVSTFVCETKDIEQTVALMRLWGIPEAIISEVDRIASIGCDHWAH